MHISFNLPYIPGMTMLLRAVLTNVASWGLLNLLWQSRDRVYIHHNQWQLLVWCMLYLNTIICNTLMRAKCTVYLNMKTLISCILGTLQADHQEPLSYYVTKILLWRQKLNDVSVYYPNVNA